MKGQKQTPKNMSSHNPRSSDAHKHTRTHCLAHAHSMSQKPTFTTTYRERCFLIVTPLMMILLMGISHTPIIMKCFLGFICVVFIVGFPRIVLFGMKWFVGNGVLVRQLCRVDQKLR